MKHLEEQVKAAEQAAILEQQQMEQEQQALQQILRQQQQLAVSAADRRQKIQQQVQSAQQLTLSEPPAVLDRVLEDLLGTDQHSSGHSQCLATSPTAVSSSGAKERTPDRIRQLRYTVSGLQSAQALDPTAARAHTLAVLQGTLSDELRDHV